MGCASSSPAEPQAQTTRVPKPGVPKPGATTSGKMPAPPAVKKPVINLYDTHSAASYSKDSGKPAFFGLLNDNDKKLYERTLNTKKSSVDVKKCPHDDAVGCKGENLLQISGNVMSLDYVVLVGAPNCDEEKVSSIVSTVFATVNKHLNNWNPDSEVSKVNKLTSGKSMEVSKELREMMELVDEAYDLTGERFDPTVESLGNFWKQKLEGEGHAPQTGDVLHLKFCLGWREKVSRSGNKVTLKNSNTALDFCGIAKGHTVDLILSALKLAGYKDVYIDWAGDIRAIGNHPSGRAWKTAIMRPPDLKNLFKLWAVDKMEEALTEDDGMFLVDLDNFAIATSGDYFSIQKFGYHHIIDRHSMEAMKAGANTVGSVSIIGQTCAIADAVATAAMTCKLLPECEQFLKEVMGASPKIKGYCIISRDGTVASTSQVLPIARAEAPEAPAPAHKQALELGQGQMKELQTLMDSIAQSCAILRSNDTLFLVDTVTSCSLNPPMVTMVLPKDDKAPGAVSTFFTIYLVNEAHKKFVIDTTFPCVMDSAFEPLLEKSTILSCSTRSSFEGTETNSTGALVLLADVINIKLLRPAPGALYLKRGNVKVAPKESNPDTRNLYDMDIDDLLRASMGQSPSTIGIVTIQSMDGSKYAMTASSLRICRDFPDLVTFNVLKDSVWGMALVSAGDVVALHMVTESSSHLATSLGKEPEISEDLLVAGMDPPILKGMTYLTLVITSLVAAGDHSFAQAKVVDFKLPELSKEPVAYFHGKYLSL